MPPALAAGVAAEIRRATLARCREITQGARATAANDAWRSIDWQFRLMLVSFFLPHLDGQRATHQPWAKFTNDERRVLSRAVLDLQKQAGNAAPRLRA
jgi:hypothetical protein